MFARQQKTSKFPRSVSLECRKRRLVFCFGAFEGKDVHGSEGLLRNLLSCCMPKVGNTSSDQNHLIVVATLILVVVLRTLVIAILILAVEAIVLLGAGFALVSNVSCTQTYLIKHLTAAERLSDILCLPAQQKHAVSNEVLIT